MTDKNKTINEEPQTETGAPINETVQQEEITANSEEKNTEVEATEDSAEANESNTQEQQAEKDPLAAALAEIEEIKTQMLYKQAEFENFRKRTLKEKADLILNGGEKTVKAILPILDDFERAITQAEKSDDITAIREGMELIFKKFLKTLEGQGVQKIDTTDQDFNTDYHEAVALVPGMGDDKKGKVIDCVQTGYMLNEKVIRHAKVAVGQ
ncbi:MAG: nucleotide exchange factor GrpE [Prevotella sp.]|jgi:molecular chaperone GrpE|nr:nucleotide exchange factor GrpE [Prevotella sp.]